MFSVIHHLFFSSNGISAIVFSLTEMVTNTERCLDGIRRWLNSVISHTLTEAPIRMTPIVFIGTHRDEVPSASDHEQISHMLEEAFGRSIAWSGRFVLSDEFGVGTRGSTTLHFFPIDNTLGRSDPTMIRLLSLFETTIAKSDYVNQMIPLTWLKCIDELTDQKTNYLPLSAVRDIASRVGVESNTELVDLLTFLNKV